MRLPLLLLSLLLASPALAQDYRLVWEDDFDGSSLDLSKWETQLGTGCPNLCGWGNNELQYYRAQNAVVGGGVLRIIAREQSFGGASYPSARIRSRLKGDWTFGRVEMRAQMPTGQGLWAALWMLPTDEEYGGWAASGEIDIMEYLGHQTNRVFGTLHYGGSWPANTYTSRATTLDSGTLDDGFHDFAFEWEPCEMRWYIDGDLYATQTSWWSSNGSYPAPFDQRFHLLLNLAVGGNLPGSPDGTTVFPQEYVVDYVKVYRKNDGTDCTLMFDGMDHGNPFGNDWFQFNGDVGGGGIEANFGSVPPGDVCRASLQTGWGSGGTPGFFGGFGRRNPTDLSGSTHFSFWIDPDAAQQYTLEINLQDDDDGNGTIPSAPDGNDDEWQATVTVAPAGGDVVAGGGWQRVDIPLSSFVDDNSFHFGGNGVFDPFAGGNGELINVVWAVLGTSGSDASFRTDRWAFTRQTASIAGRVFEDANANGADDGEPGLAGVPVSLWNVATGLVEAQGSTGTGGEYSFGGLLGQDYEVRVDATNLGGGYEASVDPDGIATLDLALAPLGCDETLANWDFGYAPVATAAPAARDFRLGQNQPNPFNPRTTIRFELPRSMPAELVVHDAAGRRVEVLHRGNLEAGEHQFVWNGRDDSGREVAGGVYFYTLRTSDGEWTRRMVLLK